MHFLPVTITGDDRMEEVIICLFCESLVTGFQHCCTISDIMNIP